MSVKGMFVFLVVALASVPAFGQAAGGGGGGAGGGGRGNPAQFRQQMEQRMKDALGVASSALAQDNGQHNAPPKPSGVNSAQSLKLPENAQIFGNAMPSVVKATAIVNGDVITPTDIDQRLAWLMIANGQQVSGDELKRLRDQVLRNIIDETLEIQAAKTEKRYRRWLGYSRCRHFPVGVVRRARLH